MVNVLKLAFLAVAKRLIVAAFNEDTLTKIVVSLLEEGAKRTDWELDDRIIAEIKDELPLYKKKAL
jgi:hypothetical protein